MSLAELQLDQQEQTGDAELLALIGMLLSITGGTYPTNNRTKRAVLERLSLKAKIEMRSLGQQLADGDIATIMWYVGMQALIEEAHTSAGVLYVEGPENYGPVARDIVEVRVAEQDNYLAGFLAAILAGTVAATRIPGRSGSYGPAVTGTYYAEGTVGGAAMGFDIEENILNPADHCEGANSCPGETAKGQVPIGTLILVGNRACGSECKCNIRQINSSTGEVRII